MAQAATLPRPFARAVVDYKRMVLHPPLVQDAGSS